MFKPLENNVVIVTSILNPSIYSDTWYVTNEVFETGELIAGQSFLTPDVSQINTKELTVQVTINQFVIFFKPEVTVNNELLEKIKKLIKTLFQKNVSIQAIAIGVNLSFETEDLSNSEEVTKKLQFAPTLPLHMLLKGENMRFGSYISKNFLETRLRVDIKPYLNDKDKSKERLKIAYNYHKDIVENNIEDMIYMIDHWLEFKMYSDKTTDDIKLLM